MAKIQLEKPDWLLGDTQIERRRFHDREIEVFVGDVALTSIEGWVGNPRTELQAGQFLEDYGRLPNNDEMYQLVLADSDTKDGLKIKELAGNIHKNGIRIPIVLTYDGKLLDGNRRYYASTFLTKDGAVEPERDRFASIPAIVLPKGTSAEVEDAIMTEFNFASDFREEWPYYVKAMKVYEDHVALTKKEDLERKYAWPWRVLNTWIKAAELCERFLNYHERSFPARDFAYRNFIMFDEMARGYRARFSNAEFRESVFELLLDGYPGNHRFKKSADVIRLDEIRDNPDAWDVITSRKGPSALKDALRILEVSDYDNVADTNTKFRRAVKSLEKLVNNSSLGSADRDLLDDFHTLAEQVPGAAQEPSAQVSKMIEWLDQMTSLQMAEMSNEVLEKLGEALTRVLKMAATKDEPEAALKRAKR